MKGICNFDWKLQWIKLKPLISIKDHGLKLDIQLSKVSFVVDGVLFNVSCCFWQHCSRQI